MSSQPLPRVLAELVGDMVLVRDTDHMKFLWDAGYFGKGLLSRSEPMWRFGRTFAGRRKRKGRNVALPKATTEIEATEEMNVLVNKIPEWEDLQLDWQETMYLLNDVKCLDLISRPLAVNSIPAEDHLMNVEEAWKFFTTGGQVHGASNRFIVNYVAYHYFRSRGWVVRSGLKFGVDYVLYRQGPHEIHSEFAVLVIPNHGSQGPPPGYVPPITSWLSLLSNARVGSQVKKEIILCHVMIPSSCPDLSNPDCISAYSVSEVILKRWVPQRTR